jgi:catecholate siderophore receptor
MHVRHLALLSASYLVATAPLIAQERSRVAQDTSARRSADSVTKQLGRIRVIGERTSRKAYSVTTSRTASRTNTPLRDTPQSVSVVTSGLIADKAMQNMSDVVQYLPGITMATGESHHDAPVIRGNSTTADFFVNGVRDDAQFVRDLYNVLRVEAIKGANAMIFGRGGAGGVINRVLKDAIWSPVHTLTLEGGSNDHKRSTLDGGTALGDRAAVRFNGMYEKSGGFRENAMLHRFGVNPSATVLPDSKTVLHLDYEHFDDTRNVDRGIPSLRNAPAPGAPERYFGDPAVSHAFAHVDGARIVAERSLPAGLALRNTSSWGSYSKFYQNVFPGSALDAAGTSLNLSGYNNRILRDNLINQTDLTSVLSTGSVRHTLLAGAELLRQRTATYRATAYFSGGSSTSLAVPFSNPSLATSATFRQSATDADNNSRADVGALYVQDQVTLTSMLQAVAGVRVERFTQHFHNNRTGDDLRRYDRLVSQRFGLIFKPAEPVSIYGSSSVAYLPSSGDQFSSLTVTTQTLEPEQFRNYEIGAKWDASEQLSLTAAAYRLDRSNSQAPDPTTPGRIVQTGARRTTGYELGGSGRVTDAWSMIAGYAVQRAVITGTTTTAPAGATIQLVPHHTISLWNRYDLSSSLGTGVGVVHQARMYAAIDNTVVLPAYTRLDGGLFFTLRPDVRAQVNIENITNRLYYPTSQGNNNIMPGAPRTVRISLSAGR